MSYTPNLAKRSVSPMVLADNRVSNAEEVAQEHRNQAEQLRRGATQEAADAQERKAKRMEKKKGKDGTNLPLEASAARAQQEEGKPGGDVAGESSSSRSDQTQSGGGSFQLTPTAGSRATDAGTEG